MCKLLISSWIRFWMLSPIKKIQIIFEIVLFLFLYMISLLPAWLLWWVLWEMFISHKLYYCSDDLGFVPSPLPIKYVHGTGINCEIHKGKDCYLYGLYGDHYLNGMNEFTLTIVHYLFFIGMVATAFPLKILIKFIIITQKF